MSKNYPIFSKLIATEVIIPYEKPSKIKHIIRVIEFNKRNSKRQNTSVNRKLKENKREPLLE